MRNLTALLILWTFFEIRARPEECDCQVKHDVAWCCGGRVKVSRSGGFWEVKCQKGDISCDTLPRLEFGANSTIDLRVDHCSLASLQCLPQRLAATDVRQLELYCTQGVNLTTDLVKEMDLDTFQFVGEDESVSMNFPREPLSQHPKLYSITFKEVTLSLHTGDLDAFSALQFLMLTDTHVRNIPLKLFRNVRNLEELTLNRNEIEEIPDDLFDGLSHLRVVHASSNRLTSLAFLTRVNLPTLTTVDVADNRLMGLPRLSSLTGLAELHLHSQKGLNHSQPFVVSPLALANLVHLTTLSLRACRLSELPNDMLHNSFAIKDIDLSQNELETLPLGLFRDLHNLETLNLDENHFASLPPDVFAGLTALRTLSLRHNRIEELSKGIISTLTSLHALHLSHNAIHKMASMSLPDSLQVLDLDHNQLNLDDSSASDDSTINNYTTLKCLLSLRELSISHNRLTRIPPDLSNLKKLRAVNLSHNNITAIWDGGDTRAGIRWWNGSEKITNLHLLSTHITIDLRHNQISTIDIKNPTEDDTDHTINRVILLDNNPLNCDCKLYNLAKNLQGHRTETAIYKLGDSECASPESFKGELVKTLPLKNFICQIAEKYNCSNNCECQYRPYTNAIELNCIAEPDIYPDLIPNAMYEISFRQVSKSLALNTPGVRKVNLSGLAMHEIPIVIPNTVEELDLSNNSLSRIPAELLEKNVILSLAGNPFECDCWHKDDIRNLQNHSSKIRDWEVTTCSDKIPIRTVNPEQLCSTLLAAAVGGTFALIGVLIAATTAVLYLCSFEVKVFLYNRSLCSCLINEQELDKDKKYDAFISFCQKDEEFVLENLVPGLETEPYNYKICVHVRDWNPGEWIPAQIATSVESSRRTIIVVSKNFLDSIWSRLEFRAANMHAVQERRSRVIVVLLEDIAIHEELDPELKAYLSTNTYLKWGDPWFWPKLRYAMPHKGVRGREARMAEAKARQEGQRLAKHLATIDLQLAERKL